MTLLQRPRGTIIKKKKKKKAEEMTWESRETPDTDGKW